MRKFKGEYFNKSKSITFKELREKVRLCQIALKSHGVRKGDRVVGNYVVGFFWPNNHRKMFMMFTGYMPNCIECLVAMLATASIGAIWSCASPDFGSTVSPFNLIVLGIESTKFWKF